MADKEETGVIKVTVPKSLHEKLRKISQQTGVPMSTLLVMAAVKEYNLVDEQESK
ncbi:MULTISPECIES: ribbon-helix-helix domain-containing protein [unclassified Microcoleus]|uniref:ribbon-helix-helix domain-containing protein n=1 Tax=unclassified Microcoleus TaxID=2642155 RepID=UPI0025DA62F2|nr:MULTISPECIES: ribbon-helix-helix domain-containing protein [unclassified Microcoleus]